MYVIRTAFKYYQEHKAFAESHGWDCFSAHQLADKVPALIAEVERLRRLLGWQNTATALRQAAHELEASPTAMLDEFDLEAIQKLRDRDDQFDNSVTNELTQ